MNQTRQPGIGMPGVRPIELLLGVTGAYKVLPAGDHDMDVICRNSLKGEDTLLTVPGEVGQRIYDWIFAGKPTAVHVEFSDLTVDQREQLQSGITPEQWIEIFGQEEDYE